MLRLRIRAIGLAHFVASYAAFFLLWLAKMDRDDISIAGLMLLILFALLFAPLIVPVAVVWVIINHHWGDGGAAAVATYGAVFLMGYVLFMRKAVIARERHVRGLCPSCGYDLRASSGRCPECGTPIS